jgi:hypothetical protein
MDTRTDEFLAIADLLPSLRAVWLGFSGGSMAMAPRIGEEFVSWRPPTGGDEALGMVDFSIFPHLDHENLPENSMADAERWAAKVSAPRYAIDDQTAIKVTGGTVEAVSEGHWKLFTPNAARASSTSSAICARRASRSIGELAATGANVTCYSTS